MTAETAPPNTDERPPSRHRFPYEGRRRRRWDRAVVATFAGAQGVLLVWWIGFYPGTLSYDSVTYVWQVSTGNWTTQHSVLYNALVWLSLRASGSLGPLTLLQTVAMAGGLAYAVGGLRRLPVPRRWLVVAAIGATCLPVVGTFTVYVSKDVAFAITQVWLLGTIARIIVARIIVARTNRSLWLVLAAEFVGLGLFRQNGFVVIGLTAVILAVVLNGQRWRVIGCGAAGLAVGLLANVALYPALGVRPVGSELLLGPAYADIAVAYSHRPEAFTPAETDLMARVAPLSYWSSSANCYNADSTVSYGSEQFDIDAARAHERELASLWLRLIRRMPDELVTTRLCRGAIAWNPFPGPAHGRTVKIPIAGTETYFNFPADLIRQSPYANAVTVAPLNGTVHNGDVFLRRLSDTRSFEWFAWRGATWCYVAYLAVLLFARRLRQRAVLGLVAVVAANQLNVLVNNPGQLVRYMAAPIILGILLLPLLFVTRRRLETGHTTELPVTRVTESGHDEGPIIQLFVDGGRHDPQRQA